MLKAPEVDAITLDGAIHVLMERLNPVKELEKIISFIEHLEHPVPVHQIKGFGEGKDEHRTVASSVPGILCVQCFSDQSIKMVFVLRKSILYILSAAPNAIRYKTNTEKHS